MKKKPVYIGKAYNNILSEQQREARRVPIWVLVHCSLDNFTHVIHPLKPYV
jgi:hypothetical protein